MNQDKQISRRDFLNGMAISAASLAMVAQIRPKTFAQPLSAFDKTSDFSLCHKIWRGEAFALPAPGGHLYDCIIVAAA